MPMVHSTSASGRHIPPHEVKPGLHSQRPSTQRSPPAHGPLHTPPQPSLSPQRTPGHVGTHASAPPSTSIPPSNGGGTTGLGLVPDGATNVETHAPLSPHVCPFSSHTPWRVHGSTTRQRVSGSAHAERRTMRKYPCWLGTNRNRTSRRRTVSPLCASMRAVIDPSRAAPCRGTSTNDGALPLRKYLATMLMDALLRAGVSVPNGRSPSRAYTRRSKGPSPGMSVSTITSTSVAGTMQPDATLVVSSASASRAVSESSRTGVAQSTRSAAGPPKSQRGRRTRASEALSAWARFE